MFDFQLMFICLKNDPGEVKTSCFFLSFIWLFEPPEFVLLYVDSELL